MRTLRIASVAFAIALLPTSGVALAMTDEQRSELRERAAGLQTKRGQNPAWDGGETRLNDTPAEVPPKRARGEVKTKTAKEKRAQREPPEKRITRRVKELPGSLMRQR